MSAEGLDQKRGSSPSIQNVDLWTTLAVAHKSAEGLLYTEEISYAIGKRVGSRYMDLETTKEAECTVHTQQNKGNNIEEIIA